MAISRPLQIVLAVAVLALVGFYATQGARNASESSEMAAPATPAEPAPKPQAAEPRQTADASRQTADASAADKAAKSDTAKKSDAGKRAKPARAKRAAVSGPVAARRAIGADKTVVLYFHGPASADETAAARAVAGLEGKRGVTVIEAPIERLDAYQDLIGQLGIAQAPAIVIVGRKRAARVIEGYVDPPTLAQDVADAR